LTAKLPTRAYELDACFDLYSDHDVLVENRPIAVKMGIKIAIPVGYEGVVRSRSSSFAKKNLNIYVGTIDSGYRGEVMCFVNTIEPETWYEVKKGEAICQIALRKVPAFTVLEVVDLPESERGEKGWGSSG
jgi:dUTP pyrophosphatase